MKPIVKTLLWLTAFSIAMGYLETAVVVYMRKLYYPGGFQFPLIPVTRDIAITEFFREVATMVMLVGVGVMAGKNTTQRFVFFLYSFAVWDIFYYVFLKVLLGWPESLFTWDILFLIPVPWVGPVVAPCMISLSMIVFTFIVVYFQEKLNYVRINFFEWILFIFGSGVAITSFMWDYFMYVNAQRGNIGWTLSGHADMFEEVKNYIPRHFNWGLFGAGQALIVVAILLVFKRLKHQSNIDMGS